MSVVFEGQIELGGQSAESRRLTYAWRLRHLLTHNSTRQRFLADVLQALIIFFTLAATVAAVLFLYFRQVPLDPPSPYGINASGNTSLLKLNLLLPLAATILRGVQASINPSAKWAVLKIAAMKVESEIYLYRTKVGPYSIRKNASGGSSSQGGSNSSNSAGGNKKDKDDAPMVVLNPRKLFSAVLDSVWVDLAASGILSGYYRVSMIYCMNCLLHTPTTLGHELWLLVQ